MFLHYRTLGFILKKQDKGEADQLLTIYTKDFGKLEILAKAIRKISSKLRAGIEMFYLSEIEFIQGKTYKTLTDAVLIDRFQNIRNDLRKLRISYKISEVLQELIRGQEKDPEIWQLLNEVFQKFNNYTLDPKRYTLIYYYFVWNLFSILGYSPQLYTCVLCQKKLRIEKLYFSPKEGGVICSKCYSFGQKSSDGVKSIIAIDPDAIKILRIILKKNWLVSSKLKLEKSHLTSLNKITKYYFSYFSVKL